MIEWRLQLYLDCRVTLRNAGVEGSDIFMPEEIRVIPCNNDLERLGVIVKANEFVRKFTMFEDETFEDTYNNTSGDRGGRFDCHDNYFVRDNNNFYAGAFVHVGDVSYAEIWSKRKDCIVAYVRM